MKKARLYLDVSRLLTRILNRSPTGIDRVEYEYACHFFKNTTEFNSIGILTTPWFSGAMPIDVVQEGLSRVKQLWRLDLSANQDPIYISLSKFLQNGIETDRNQHAIFSSPYGAQKLRDALLPISLELLYSAYRLKALTRSRQDKPSVYLHTSHGQLEKKRRFAWVEHASAQSVFFVHDIIPVDYPEYCPIGAAKQHEMRLKTISCMAAATIVNSDVTANALVRFFTSRQLRLPKIITAPLGLSRAFSECDELPPPPPNVPYFVHVGTIEPRKNHVLLFHIWRRLIERNGTAPRLVLVGRRGWENENAVDILDRSHSLAPYIVEVADLSDAGLSSLLRSCCALLAPSIVEGFGLPVKEALSLGVPVIASSIDAHREVSGGHALLLDPLDGTLWTEAIEALLDNTSPARLLSRNRTKYYDASLNWHEHFAKVADVLKTVQSDLSKESN